MTLRPAVLFLLGSLGLAACAGSRPQTVAESIRTERPFVSIALLPLASDLDANRASAPTVGAAVVGNDTFYRLFDLLLAEATGDRILKATELAALGPAAASADSSGAGATGLFSETEPRPLQPLAVGGRRPDLLLIIDDLDFQDHSEETHFVVGSKVHGRRFLNVEAVYTLYDNETLAVLRSGSVSGSTVVNQVGVNSWRAYADALEALAPELVRDAGLRQRPTS